MNDIKQKKITRRLTDITLEEWMDILSDSNVIGDFGKYYLTICLEQNSVIKNASKEKVAEVYKSQNAVLLTLAEEEKNHKNHEKRMNELEKERKNNDDKHEKNMFELEKESQNIENERKRIAEERKKIEEERIKNKEEIIRLEKEIVKIREEKDRSEKDTIKAREEAIRSEKDAIKFKEEAIKEKAKAIRIREERLKSESDVKKYNSFFNNTRTIVGTVADSFMIYRNIKDIFSDPDPYKRDERIQRGDIFKGVHPDEYYNNEK